MPTYRRAESLEQADGAAPEELLLVRAGELQRWAAELRAAADAERQACRKIAEDHLRLLLEERHLDPALLLERVVFRIDERGRAAEGVKG